MVPNETLSCSLQEASFFCPQLDNISIPLWRPLVNTLCKWMSLWYSFSMIDRHKTAAKTIRLEDQDREAVARIRELYGCTSDNAAIKLALRIVARQDLSIQIVSKKEQTREVD